MVNGIIFLEASNSLEKLMLQNSRRCENKIWDFLDFSFQELLVLIVTDNPDRPIEDIVDAFVFFQMVDVAGNEAVFAGEEFSEIPDHIV